MLTTETSPFPFPTLLILTRSVTQLEGFMQFIQPPHFAVTEALSGSAAQLILLLFLNLLDLFKRVQNFNFQNEGK